MKIGTVRGALPSYLRNLLVALLVRTPLRRIVVRHFTMLTVPFYRRKEAAGELRILAAEGEAQEGKKQ